MCPFWSWNHPFPESRVVIYTMSFNSNHIEITILQLVIKVIKRGGCMFDNGMPQTIPSTRNKHSQILLLDRRVCSPSYKKTNYIPVEEVCSSIHRYMRSRIQSCTSSAYSCWTVNSVACLLWYTRNTRNLLVEVRKVVHMWNICLLSF